MCYKLYVVMDDFVMNTIHILVINKNKNYRKRLHKKPWVNTLDTTKRACA